MFWLLGILGGLGALGGGAVLLGGGPAMLLAGGKALALLRRIPPKAWIYVAIAAAVVAAFFVHQHIAHTAIKSADEAGYARGVKVYQRALEIVHARAVERQRQFERKSATITTDVRTRHDQNDRNSSAIADDLRVRGPGAARCRPVDHPGLPAVAGGRQSPGGAGAAQMAGLPDEGGPGVVAVPFPGAVAFAEASDLNRNEVLAWREWYGRQVEAWEKLRHAKPPH